MPISSLLSCSFLLAPSLAVTPMATRRKFSAAEKGKAPREGPGSPAPKRGRGRPRKHAATPAVAHCRGGATARGVGHPSHGGPVDEGRHTMVARPPRPSFHTAEVSSEFVVWSENPAGNWLQLLLLCRRTAGLWSKRTLAAGKWLQQQSLLGFGQDFCCGQHSPSPRLADIRPRMRPGQAVHPQLQVRWWVDPLCEGVWGRWTLCRVLLRGK